MPETTMTEVKRSLAQQRVAKGLCPQCGAEAAPYRLCKRHRDVRMVGRLMDRFAALGAVTREKRGGQIYYEKKDLATLDTAKIRPRGWDLPETDKRRRPRLGGVPVDIIGEVVGILAETGRPLATEEMVAAWGRLRETRKAGSIAGNLTALITAERRRQDRAMKRQRRP
jgi:hypothetical protein